MQILILLGLLGGPVMAESLNAGDTAKAGVAHRDYVGTWHFKGVDCLAADGTVIFGGRWDQYRGTLVIGNVTYSMEGTTNGCELTNSGVYSADFFDPNLMSFVSRRNTFCPTENGMASWTIGRTADGLKYRAQIKKGELHLHGWQRCEQDDKSGTFVLIFDPPLGS